MRKFVGTVAIGILLAIAPAGAAFSQTAEQTAQPTTATVVQAQDNDDDGGGNGGLWGLLGLLGLAGLIPRKNKQQHRNDATGSTRM